MIRIVFGAIFFVLCFQVSGLVKWAYSGDPYTNEVLEAPEKDVQRNAEGKSNVGAWVVSLFSKHISAVDGDRCPSEPTCSSYSVQAFKKHGLVMGWLMTVDRLIHEADEWRFSPVKSRGGKGKIMDPVENNDYWWVENHWKDENQ